MASRNDDDDDERPVKKKKKKKPQSAVSPILLIGGGAAVLLLLCGIAAGSAYFFLRADPVAAKRNEQAKLDEKAKKNAPEGGAPGGAVKAGDPEKKKSDEGGAFRIAPKIEDGSPTKKGGAGVIQNTRGAVYRTERKSELGQLRLSYTQFFDEYKGNARTKENFLEYIKTFGPIRDAVKDGYYQMNMKARLDSDNIIAYERDEDAQGHLSVRANGAMEYVRSALLKKEIGIP